MSEQHTVDGNYTGEILKLQDYTYSKVPGQSQFVSDTCLQLSGPILVLPGHFKYTMLVNVGIGWNPIKKLLHENSRYESETC